MPNTYGQFIRHHRLASGYKSQKSFADATGISGATISRIEDEKHRPLPETLLAFSKKLHTTTWDELMVACGYGDEETLEKVKNPSSVNTEKELIEKIDLSDEDLLKQYKLVIDGRELTLEEARGILAFVRVQRDMK